MIASNDPHPGLRLLVEDCVHWTEQYTHLFERLGHVERDPVCTLETWHCQRLALAGMVTCGTNVVVE